MPPINNPQMPAYVVPGQAPLQPTSPSKGPSNMKWVLICVVLGVFFLVSLIFGFWAFGQMQDYKNNSDKKSAVAVTKAEAVQEEKLKAEFAEQEKSPYKTYQSAADFGAVKIVYPKTWGAFVDESQQGSSPVNGFFNPNFVPNTGGNLPIALRVQVSSKAYAQSIKEFDSAVRTGTLTAQPVTLEQVKGVTGMRYDGKVTAKYNGSLIVFPLRDKTLKIWTENPGNVADLNNIVLKNLTFTP